MRNALLSMMLLALSATAAASDPGEAHTDFPAQLRLDIAFGETHATTFRLNGIELAAAERALAQNDTGGIDTEPMNTDDYTIGDEPYEFDPDVPPPKRTTTDTTTTTTGTPTTGTRTTTARTTTRTSGWSLTPIQWLGIGAAALAVGVVLADSGGGDEEPRVSASGGN